MDKDIMERLMYELQYAADSVLEDVGLKAEVEFYEDSSINAGVRRNHNIPKVYTIRMYTGVFDSLKQALEEKYHIAQIQEEKFAHYEFETMDTTYQHYDNSTLQNSFMDIMVKFISHNILFHECGHILLGHCDGRLSEMLERATSKEKHGGYGLQAREMMADWYGVKKAMQILLFSFAQSCRYSVKDINDLLIIRKCLFLALLALFCQFDLFEGAGTDVDEFSECTLRKRSHPHPYIRLIYGCDAMKETVMDVIERFQSIGDTMSEHIVNDLLNTVIDDLLEFLGYMSLNDVRFDWRRPELIECYYSIWKKAVLKKHSAKPYINMKMQKMPIQYLESIRACKMK